MVQNIGKHLPSDSITSWKT